MTTNRRGFSLVELLVVSVLGSLLLMATYQILITNQQTYRENADQVRGQQTARMGLEIVAAELREMRPADITSLGVADLTYDAMTNFGIVCGIDYGPPVKLTVAKFEAWIGASSKVVVFADNNSALSNDDVWITANATARDTTSILCGTNRAQDLTFTGQEALFIADSVRTGAPIRGVQSRRILEGFSGGTRYIYRDGAPLVGPIPSTGFRLAYYDEAGNTATSAATVHSITIRVISEHGDTLSTTVYPRN